MFRLLGILSLGHLLFGGRHHRRALRRGLLFGVLLGWFMNRDFDMDRVQEDVQETARKVKRTAHEAVRAAKWEIRDARKAEHDREIQEKLNRIHEEAAARKEAREARKAERVREVRALPESGTREAQAIQDLTEDLERDARTAAMGANVPTIQFPEDDEKYHASRKYGYA